MRALESLGNWVFKMLLRSGWDSYWQNSHENEELLRSLNPKPYTLNPLTVGSLEGSHEQNC